MIEQFYWFEAGYCTALDAFSRRGGRWRNIRFPAAVGLLRHSRFGWILFDTGYTPQFFEATRQWPFRMFRWLTPVFVKSTDTVAAQLKAAGIDPQEVKTVLLSHLHADHAGGMHDFIHADIYLHANCIPLLALEGRKAANQGILPAVLPPDIAKRSHAFRNDKSQPHDDFGKCWDMLGDGSITIVPLPGHAIGQVGAIFRFREKQWLLAADAAWHTEEIEQQKMPPFPGNLIVQNKIQYKNSLKAIQQWWLKNPGAAVIPTHCNRAFQQYNRPLHHV